MSEAEQPTPLTMSAKEFAGIEQTFSQLRKGKLLLDELHARELAHAATREQLDALKSLKVMQEIVALREQLKEVSQKDTGRLDWLDGDNWWDFCRSANPREPEKTFHLDVGEGEYCETYSEKSAREAIDAALRAKQEPPQALPPAEDSAEDTTGLQGGKP